MCLPLTLQDRIVQGLCHTDQWKRSLSMLNGLNETSRFALNTIAAKAFSEGEIDLGFRLLHKPIHDGYEIHPNVCASYWTFCRQHSKSIVENVERMLKYLEKTEKILSKTSMQQLHNLLNEYGSIGRFTEVSQR